jgi:UDP-N-acetyl-D-glucosamine 4,6-dehydratase
MISSSPLKRFLFFVMADMSLSILTLYFAYNLRFNFQVPSIYMHNFLLVFFLLVSLKILCIYFFKIYYISWRFVSLLEIKKLFYAHVMAYGIFIVIFYLLSHFFNPFPRSVLIIDFFLSMAVLGGLRMAKRLLIESEKNRDMPRTLLIGVSSFAQTLLKEQHDYYIVAVVDDSRMIIGSYFSNLRVQPIEKIESVIHENEVHSVIIAKDFPQAKLRALYTQLNDLGIYNIKVVALNQNEKMLKQVTVEDLLARHPKDLNLKTIEAFIKGKTILITGAGGSIGSEISRQCARFGAKALILVDHSEYNLYQVGELVGEADLRLVNVTDKALLTNLFDEVHPQIVIHAAAYKHVPICEHNPDAAVENNVLGTKNVIDVSIACDVEKLVIVSTDKAVRPTNVMGATKRVTELYAQNIESKNTEIVAVRFGNVLGSSGSVIPKFKQQIEAGGPVTVTHPEITRYFMMIPEACQLVLQTAAIAKGGELFILDMGEPIKIVDLAKQMIRLYGKVDEVEIKFTGLRPGEKLYEELLIDESEQKTKYSSIFIAKPTPYEIEKLSSDIEYLLQAEDKIEALKRIVPEFTRKDLI